MFLNSPRPYSGFIILMYSDATISNTAPETNKQNI